MESTVKHQNNKLNTFELLAPAGSFEIFKAVIAAGADAVYVGGSMFGARAYANNFTAEELLEAIDYAHLYGRKVYLTVNTLLKNEEMELLYDYLFPFYERGLDAVLVQDFGVLSFIRKEFPDLPVHTSTQMTVTGVEGARFLQKLGVERIVMAREMSLAEMKEIHEKTGMELEAFVHGALCYCYSGQCLLSSMLGGRSGNRGRCAQPCRLPYAVLDQNREEYRRDSYVLSLKDLCGIEDLNRLRKAGVYSLKIEGRMKQAAYAAGVVSIYRKYIDYLLSMDDSEEYAVDPKDMQKLAELGSRCGFTNEYYSRQNGSDMVTFIKPGYEKTSEELQNRILDQYVHSENKIAVEGTLTLKCHQPASYEVRVGDTCVCVCGMEVMEAKKKPLTAEEVQSRMRKTGDTPFYMNNVRVVLDEQVFLPNGALNQLRRDALEQLKEEMLCSYRRNEGKKLSEYARVRKTSASCGNPAREVACLTEKRELIPVILKKDFVTAVYLEIAAYDIRHLSEELAEDLDKIRKTGKKVYFALPRIFRKKTSVQYERIQELLGSLLPDGFLVRNYEELAWVKDKFADCEIVTDHNLYTYNNLSAESYAAQGAVRSTIPLELNKKELLHRDNLGCEMIIYGYYPLMTSAQCVHGNTKECDGNPTICYLKDRYKTLFPVRNYCSACYNVIYNSLPVMLFANLKELCKAGITNYRLDFVLENPKQTQAILDLMEEFWEEKRSNYPDNMQNQYTNGHYKRGVE